MNNLDLLRPTVVFAAVVDSGSFRSAADQLGLSAPYVSQLVSELESRLGRQLLYRTTRKLSLTAEGEVFLEHARKTSEAFRDGVLAVHNQRRALSGRLRVSVPTVLASSAFAQSINRFVKLHPAMRLEIDMNDHVVDPVQARMDLVIRVGDPGNDPRRARRLFTTSGVVCCAPSHAAHLRSPAELTTSVWLRSPAMSDKLQLVGPRQRSLSITPAAQVVINSASLIQTMVSQGAGFALFPSFAVADSLREGRLALAVPEWTISNVPVHALYTDRRTSLTNARSFVDHLLEFMSDGNDIQLDT